MATNSTGPTIGATIVLDGEREYKKALQDINAEQKENRSEMALAAAQYDENDRSIEALTARQKVLTDAVEIQQRKVATLRGALEKAIEVYGASSAKTKTWQTQLNYAEADLAKMTRAANGNADAIAEALAELEKMTQAAKDSAKAADRAAESMEGTERVGRSLADAVNAVADAAGVKIPPALQGMVDKLDGVSASGAALVTTLAGITGMLTKAATETAAYADDLLTMAQTTGLTVEQLQKFQYAEKFIDVPAEKIAEGMTEIEKQMKSAREGSDDVLAAFERLGVRFTETNGEFRSAEEVFYDTVDALGKVENMTERDVLAMTLMSETAKEFNPVINAGSQALRDLGDEAEQVGAVLDQSTIEEFGRLHDEMDSLTIQLDETKMRLATVLLPILIQVLDVVTSINPEVLKTVLIVTSVITIIVMMVKTVSDVSSAVSNLSTIASGGIPTWMKIVGIITIIVGLLTAVLVLVTALSGKADDVDRIAQSVEGTKNSFTSAGLGTATAYRSIPQYAKGTDFHPGGLARVGEFGPEIVELPRGARVYPTGTGPAGGDTNTYVFRVDDIATYGRIERRMKFERQSRRKGYVGV